ncbi:MAG: hypothetical protein LUD17_14700 [Bacteroidales bacterium]|nr:hypothetical protein [Bacteroidales bacterium]
MTETVNLTTPGSIEPTTGTADYATQAPGAPATVSNLASATGGIAPGAMVEPDIDEQLFSFQSEDTALMSLMLRSRKVKVNSPEVEHFMIDEQRSTLTTSAVVAKASNMQFILPLESRDQNLPRDYHTLLVTGVDGYADDGSTRTPGRDLMLFVTGRDSTTNNPVVRAINGPKNARTDLYCTTPFIPKGAKVKMLANAMYETQKEVDPDLIVPQPETIYLQKRGMNQIVSDYFEAQRKHIPFSQSIIAEQAILNFKRAGNRTLWAGRKGKLAVNVPRLGEQLVYFTEGLRWQFKRELHHSGTWTIEKLIAMAKMFYTGEDVPKNATLLAGKNLLEQIQCIDFSKHPEIQILATHNAIGWAVTRIHTVFGDIDIKREPTLDTLGWSNSGALLGDDRLVHYTYSAQHEFSDRVDGEEATRRGMVVWDGLALKGACHLWIEGEGAASNASSVNYVIWESSDAPTGDDLVAGQVYLLTMDCPSIDDDAVAGSMWQYVSAKDGWSEYSEEISA